MKENEKLKKENSKLENTVIENIGKLYNLLPKNLCWISAKYQRLYKLIKEQKVVNMQHENIMNKIKYLQVIMITYFVTNLSLVLEGKPVQKSSRKEFQ